MGATPRFRNPRIMEINIGKEGQILGLYYPDGGLFVGTELTWHEGLDEWVNVRDVIK